jgi:hypothetical protein
VPKLEEDLSAYRSQFGLASCTTANGCFHSVSKGLKVKSGRLHPLAFARQVAATTAFRVGKNHGRSLRLRSVGELFDMWSRMSSAMLRGSQRAKNPCPTSVDELHPWLWYACCEGFAVLRWKDRVLGCRG